MGKYIVRYGTMRAIGVMTARTEDTFRRGMEVVVRSSRGLEAGQVLCEATEDALSHLDQPATGTIIRAIDDNDAAEVDAIDRGRAKKIDRCKFHIQALGLQMKLVEVEQLLGGQRMVVYYIADDRVDFRELVKVLSNEFKTRIEMKQIGVRDEAKILADYGDCGKPVCCNNHLVKMPPVSMKMAKLQKATLDPTKISGRCGRLKCCLRYEFDTYDEIQRQLPQVGSFVVTRDGKSRVLSQQILAEQLLVETEDHRRILIEASEVLSVIKKGSPGQARETNPGNRDPARSQDLNAMDQTATGNAASTSAAGKVATSGGRSKKSSKKKDGKQNPGSQPGKVSNKKRRRKSKRNRTDSNPDKGNS